MNNRTTNGEKVAAKLVRGQRWLKRAQTAHDSGNPRAPTDDVFLEQLDRWDNLERELRSDGFSGCIHGEEPGGTVLLLTSSSGCTHEEVVRCIHCAYWRD